MMKAKPGSNVILKFKSANWRFVYYILAALVLTSVAPAQNLFVTGTGDGLSNDGSIGEFTVTGTPVTNFAGGLSLPYGIVFDSASNLYVTSVNSNCIYKYTPDGTQSLYASGLNNPLGLVFDGAGNLFVANYNAGDIVKFQPDGTRINFAFGMTAYGVACDPAGNVYATDGLSNMVYKITPDGAASTFATDLVHPYGLAFYGTNLYVADELAGNIYKFAPDGTRANFVTGLRFPLGLACDRSGNVFATVYSGTIYEYAPDGTLINSFGSGLSNPTFLAFQPSSVVKLMPLLSQANRSGTQLQFLVSGQSNQNYTVQSSTNLNSTNWDSILVTNSPVNSFWITTTNATNSSRFYRLLLGP